MVKSGKYFELFSGKEVKNVFSGEYQHTLDAKGRVIMPVKFRESLGESFVVTRGLDSNLLVYDMTEWQKFYEKLSTLPLSNKNSRNFSRYFLASATECEMDKQGRVLIPQPLKEAANLCKDITIIGNGNKLEIWDTATWNDHINSIDTDELAVNLCECGIMI